MSGLGEWLDDPQVAQAVHDSSTNAVQDRLVAQLTSDSMDEEVSAAVAREIRKVIAPMVQQAVSDVLTPDRLETLRRAAHEAAQAQLTPRSEEPAPAGPEGVSEPYFKSVDDWVREYLCPLFRRRVGPRPGAVRWAADWWRYPEAVARLDAMWMAWETLRLDRSMGMSVWLRDHADPHLRVLFSEAGPFETSALESPPTDPLPYTPPPPGLFDQS